MTSRNDLDPPTLKTRNRNRVRITAEEAHTRGGPERAHTESIVAALRSSHQDAPPDHLTAAFTAPVGDHQVVTVPICGAIVTATIVPRGRADPARDAELWHWLYVCVVLVLADHGDIGGNVTPLPLRRQLPGEFAALRIQESIGKPILVTNTQQSPAATKLALRKLRAGIPVPVLAGAAAERIARVARGHHRAASIVAAALAVIAAVLGVLPLMSGGAPTRPPSDAIGDVASPTVTITATSTVTSSPSRVSRPAEASDRETATPRPPESPAGSPTLAVAPPRHAPEATHPPTAPPMSRPTTRPSPTPPPVSNPPADTPTTKARDCDGLPLAGKCLLD